MAKKTNSFWKPSGVAETPGFKPTIPTVSDKGISGSATKVSAKKVPNKAVSVNVRAARKEKPLTSAVKPLTGNLKTATATPQKIKPYSGPVAKITNPKPAKTTKPVVSTKPVYETPGFKPAKKTSKK